MKKTNGAFAFLLAGSLGLACGGTGLQSGSGGSGALGGAVGSGGSVWGSGGAITGGAGGSLGGGGQQNLGGSAAGGVIGSGGSVSSGGAAGSNAGGSVAGGRGGSRAGGSVSAGGRGGANAGGAVAGGRGGTNAGGSATGGTSGAGGTICPPIACPTIGCLYGELPNPDPCGCPICASPDAGVKDTGIPPADVSQPETIICPPIACPAIRCAYGLVPSPDPCGCSTCAPPPDAGADTGKLACVGLDECTCADTPGCSVMAEACYCPFPQCGAGACFCGGGRYIGCAPVELASCDSAKARVFALCPTLAGPTFDGLCAPSDDTVCITECLNEVTSCTDLFCTFCEGCDCATDRFSSCVAGCTGGVTR